MIQINQNALCFSRDRQVNAVSIDQLITNNGLQVMQDDARDTLVFLVDRISDIEMIFPNNGRGILPPVNFVRSLEPHTRFLRPDHKGLTEEDAVIAQRNRERIAAADVGVRVTWNATGITDDESGSVRQISREGTGRGVRKIGLDRL